MKAGWKTVKLGERFKIRSSKRVLQSEWKTEGVPFYRGREVTILSKSGVVDNELFISEGHFKELSAKYGVPAAGDIILTAIGTIGNAYVVKPNDRFYFKDASVLWITACAEYDSNFVNYWIKSDHFKGQLDSGNGATVDTLTLDKLKSIEIPLPPPAEQKRIVALLDEAFAGIDEAKAKAVACQENSKLIFSNYLEAVFEKKGPDWAEVAISELCDVKHGYAFEGADFSSDVPDGNPLVVTPGNFTEDGKLCFNSKNSKRLRSNPPAEFKFNIGDLVVVMTDLSSQMKILGKPAFVETDDLLHNQRIGRLIFTRERVEKRLVYFFMMTQGYLKNIKITSTGTMVKHTAPKRITSNLISFPENRAKQLAIIAKLDELRKETQRLAKIHEDKKRALIELKSSLLSQAFSGELTA